MRIDPPRIPDSQIITPNFAFKPFVQPEGECTHCGKACATLVPRTVAGYEAVVEEKLCPVCLEALGRANDFIAI